MKLARQLPLLMVPWKASVMVRCVGLGMVRPVVSATPRSSNSWMLVMFEEGERSGHVCPDSQVMMVPGELLVEQ